MKFEIELAGTFECDSDEEAGHIADDMIFFLERLFLANDANFFLAELDPVVDD